MRKMEITPIEILALNKLYIVSKALAQKLGGSAGREQDCLADTLRDVLTRYEIARVEPLTARLQDNEGEM